MKDQWIKFLKDWKDNDGKEFKKDCIIKVDEETAKALVLLKTAELTTQPEQSPEVKEILDTFKKTMEESIQGMFVQNMQELNKSVKGLKIPAIPKDEKLEKMGGFQDDGEFALAVRKAATGVVDNRLKFETLAKAPSGQNTIDDVEGGFIVPEDLQSRIVEQVWDDYEGMNVLPMTDQYFCSGDSTKVPTMPEVSRKTGYRDSGVIAYWLAEAGQFTASSIKFGAERMELNKIGVLMYATEEMLADASISLPPVFARKAASAIRFMVNKSLYDGTGVGQPTGIMRSDSTVVVALEDGQSASQAPVLHKNLIKMYYKMLPRFLPGAKWYIHPNVLEELPFIYFNDDTTNKRPIFTPPSGLSQAPYGTLLGRPIVPWEFCYDKGQKGDILFANWSPYQTLQKRGGGINYATSIHVRFLFEEQAFRWSYRIDGKSSMSAPVEDLNGSTKRSYAVVLAARTSEGSSSGL